MYLLQMRNKIIDDENSTVDQKPFRHNSKNYETEREI